MALHEISTLSERTYQASDIDAIRDRIRENLDLVRERIASAATRADRSVDDVLLVTVSKTWPSEIVQAAVEVGACTLGENRVQEAQTKVPEVDGNPAWHLVGHLQRNKAKIAVELFDTIQSVDSVRLAREIGKHAVAAGKEVAIQLQVNTSGEASKFGVAPDDLRALVDEVTSIDGVVIEGLMTIAAHTDEEAAVRGCFTRLRELRDHVSQTHQSVKHLSMGMSGDFEVAIEEGSTVVRVGTAIFGQRS